MADLDSNTSDINIFVQCPIIYKYVAFYYVYLYWSILESIEFQTSFNQIVMRYNLIEMCQLLCPPIKWADSDSLVKDANV